jgi:hypothetical protein
LAVSGLLVRDVGGASIRPYQPAGYYRHLNFPERSYEHHSDSRQWRRGVYVHWQRQFLHPMLKAFDAPRREECTASRPVSNTPLASLALLNDPTFIEAARAFAERILRHGGQSIDDRLNFAMRCAVSRSASDYEIEVLRGLIADAEEQFRDDQRAARELLSVGDSPTPTDLSATELATWTVAARALLNTSETITRN